MAAENCNSNQHHQAFKDSERKHILMITNHGIHQWKIIPGLPDTGGQNVFVNQFTNELVRQGFKVTIINRGGFKHPQTGKMQHGLQYENENSRIYYLNDGRAEFVRKEDMASQLPALLDDLLRFMREDQSSCDLVCSHYWDAAKLGILFLDQWSERVPHIWVPHSVGTLKKRNMPESEWPQLRVDQRIAIEKEMVASGKLDGIVATSSAIRESLLHDYGYQADLFLPPCIDTERYFPRDISPSDDIWSFLAAHSSLPANQIRQRKIVAEISRTDKTKRKDVVIRAFAAARRDATDGFLIISIDSNKPELAAELEGLIDQHNLREHVAVLGSVWEQLPKIYAITDVYCTPSEMEGFGMSIQEAAATKVPAVSSDLVPFAVEYLLGKNISEFHADGKLKQPVKFGDGAAVVKAGDVDGFAAALSRLLVDQGLRQKMAEAAYKITIPYFTWQHMVQELFAKINFQS